MIAKQVVILTVLNLSSLLVAEPIQAQIAGGCIILVRSSGSSTDSCLCVVVQKRAIRKYSIVQFKGKRQPCVHV